MGRYIDEILQPDEKVLYSTTIHWIVYLPAIIGWIVGHRLLRAASAGRSTGSISCGLHCRGSRHCWPPTGR